MGNLEAESSLEPTNLQNSFNSKLGLNDKEYTEKVDNGTYTNFIHDGAGYGLAQWTYYSRKQNLLNYAKSKGTSIGDLTMQLEFLLKELKTNFISVYNTLIAATSVQQASDAVLLKFENPYNASAQTSKRAQMGLKYYNQYAKGAEKVNMATNTYTKGKKTQLSTSFVSTEFDCHGKGCCTTTEINPQLVVYLQKIRDHFNAPITITSGYRCLTHNRNVGGATGSRHSKGDAADIVVKGHTPREVAQYAESIGIKGIGLYETNSDGHFTHIDVRSTKSFWYGQACSARTTFGGSTSSTANTVTSQKNYYMLNDSDEEVKEIQQMLLSLGYTLTNKTNDATKGADGIYGQLTRKAIIEYQNKKGLKPDGLTGPETIESLRKDTGKLTVSKKVEVTANVLNVRAGAGTNYAVIGGLRKGTQRELTEIQDGWGKINTPTGWISLEYVKEI